MTIENGLDLEKEAQNFHFPEETKRREDELSAAGKREDESANPDYEIFIDPEKRKEVFEYSKALSEYLKSQSISDLVLIDLCIRPMYIGVMEYWKAKYPKEKMPNIFFVNPKGFKAEGDLTEEQIDNMSFASAFKEDDYESKKLRPKEQIEKEFQETYQQLLEDKDKSVMIFDTCSHTGDSIAPVKEMFDKNGFKDLKIGTINRPDDESKIKADFSINDKDHHEYGEENCYPFFLDLMIQKTFDHVYSKVSDDPNHRKIATLLRREIKRVMKEELKNQEQVAEKAEEAG